MPRRAVLSLRAAGSNPCAGRAFKKPDLGAVRLGGCVLIALLTESVGATVAIAAAALIERQQIDADSFGAADLRTDIRSQFPPRSRSYRGLPPISVPA
ncbi:MAG: hypothetical protein CMJ58_02320 [Planctomycetaceae bacterium]|nr:hypothetical protein [Planctomycetaceae bacterium]